MERTVTTPPMMSPRTLTPPSRFLVPANVGPGARGGSRLTVRAGIIVVAAATLLVLIAGRTLSSPLTEAHGTGNAPLPTLTADTLGDDAALGGTDELDAAALTAAVEDAARAFAMNDNGGAGTSCGCDGSVLMVRFSNRFGRHGNQLKGLLHGVAMGVEVARRCPASPHVLVFLPPFAQGREAAPYSQLYDITRLSEVASRMSRGAVRLYDNYPEMRAAATGLATGSSAKREAIIRFWRRGIPSKLDFSIESVLSHLTGKPAASLEARLTSRDFAATADTVAAAASKACRADSGAALPTLVHLVFFELVYYDGVVDQAEGIRDGAPGIADQLWGGLAPSRAVAALVANVLTANPALGSALAIHESLMAPPPDDGAAPRGVKPMNAIGVHVRSLEGSCADRMKALARRRKLPFKQPPGQAIDLRWQCELGQGFDAVDRRVAAHTPDDGNNGGAASRPLTFLAVDDPAVARKLLSQSGGRGLVAPALGQDELERLARHRVPKQLGAMLRDFWLLVLSRAVIGNAASTISRNACYVRRARGALDRRPGSVDCLWVIRGPEE